METKRISELPSNDGTLNGNELLEVATMPSTGTQTVASKKSLLSEIGKWIFGRLHNSRLLTQNKTIIGAINEIKNAETGEPGSGAAHNAVYRGKCLGPAPTAEQYEAIRNNTFDDMYVGDYWYDENEGIHWRIAGFNYYHGIGPYYNKITNYHAVIVPDEPLVGDTFVNEQGELRETQIYDSSSVSSNSYPSIYYTAARGYKTAEERVTITENPPGSGVYGTVSVYVTHKPVFINNISCLILVSTLRNDSATGFLPTTQCFVKFAGDRSQISISQDSSHPDQWKIEFPCYYTQSGYNVYNWYLEITNVPSYPEYINKGNQFTRSLPNLPSGTELMISYMYYEEGYGALDEAEKIIINKFGENHILPFTFGIYVTNYAYAPSPFKDYAMQVKTDLLCAEQLTGNGSLSCIGENHYPEFIRYFLANGGTTKQITKQGSSGGILTFHYTYFANELNSRWALNRLPLFVFNPSLIYTGYSYWLSSIYSYTGENIFAPPAAHLIRNVIMDECGNQVVNTVIGQRPGTGIRPYFLLSYTSSPSNNS